MKVREHLFLTILMSSVAFAAEDRSQKQDSRPIIPKQLRSILPWTHGDYPVTWMEQEWGDQIVTFVFSPRWQEDELPPDSEGESSLDLVAMFVREKSGRGITRIEPLDLARLIYGEERIQEWRIEAATVQPQEEGTVAAAAITDMDCWGNSCDGATCTYRRGDELCLLMICCTTSTGGTSCHVQYNNCFKIL